MSDLIIKVREKRWIKTTTDNYINAEHITHFKTGVYYDRNNNEKFSVLAFQEGDKYFVIFDEIRTLKKAQEEIVTLIESLR